MAKRKKKFRFSIEGKPLYPHIKLTNERFPRVLATRLVEDDGAEYFGAFLSRTNARILINFLNKTFRLRTCEIDIDGTFNYPCTMFYKRRCVAPCVVELCGEDEYNERVKLVRAFLTDDRFRVEDHLKRSIEHESEALDYERAARIRDLLQAVQGHWSDARIDPWTSRVVDSYHARLEGSRLDIFLTSQRSRRTVGERTFTFEGVRPDEAGTAIGEVIEQFYRVHVPKEIRVSHDFVGRKDLAAKLALLAGKRLSIAVMTEKNRRVTTEIAVYRATNELDLARLAGRPTPSGLARDIKERLKLKRLPKRILAVDASHISGQQQIAACIPWAAGKIMRRDASYVVAENVSEPQSLAAVVVMYDLGAGDLILVDGGASQVYAVLGGIPAGSKAEIAGAVKPPGEHSEIMHFLLADRSEVLFDPTSHAMLLLKQLRDEAHDYANQIHRETRDFAGFYAAAEMLPSLSEPERRELVRAMGSPARVAAADEAQISRVLPDRWELAAADLAKFRDGQQPHVTPLIVPITFQDDDGLAEDLRPIETASGKARRST